MIPDKEVANINQEILNLFLNDGFQHKDPRATFFRNHNREGPQPTFFHNHNRGDPQPTFFRNHNREIHSRIMEQYPCPRRISIMATAHNMVKIQREQCFTLSLGFIVILRLLIGQFCHPISIMKPLLSLANHSLDFHSKNQLV